MNTNTTTNEPLSEQAPPPAPSGGTPKKGTQPVIIYIMILFIAAFLLMTLSFLMHQRSNTEVLGKLENSVSALQEVQDLQETIIDLQGKLDKANTQLEASRASLAEQQAEREALEHRADALLSLYHLQQLYSAKNTDACADMIARFDAGLADFLPQEAADGVVSPAERYLELKEAVEAQKK